MQMMADSLKQELGMAEIPAEAPSLIDRLPERRAG